MNLTPEQIARVCHEANRGYQRAAPSPGIPVAPEWDYFPADQRAGVVVGVELALTGATPEQLHAAWCHDKLSAGWRYGEVKDTDAKLHPCLVTYRELPAEQKVKDSLFAGVVKALAS